MNQHAQFRELLFKLHGEFCDKQIKFKGTSDFLDGNYNGKKELLQYLLHEFDKLPDIAAEVNSAIRLDKANLAAEIEKILDDESLLDGVCCLSDSLEIIDKIKLKLKELSR